MAPNGAENSSHERGLSLSQVTLRAPALAPGTLIWVEDGTEIWRECQVVSQDNTILTVEDQAGTEEQWQVDLGFHELYLSNPRLVADLTSLFYIHEPGILENLRCRSSATDIKPYTFMGTALLAVNPLRAVPFPDEADFVAKPMDPDKPHPYALAEMAFQQMHLVGKGEKSRGSDQSIVINGESGAGKTETAKIVLNYLCRRGSDTLGQSGSGFEGENAALTQSLLDSSPILEALGNAKTVRNHNSSRFGKFIKLLFSPSAVANLVLAGASIETYLLEKSRVVRQDDGERNFHIFFQLLSGASTELRHALSIGCSTSAYRYLQTTTAVVQGINDAADFAKLSERLGRVGYSDEEIGTLWEVLAGILHLGQLTFVEEESSEGSMARVADVEQLHLIADALGFAEEALKSILTERTMATVGETYTIKLTPEGAAYARDAVAKAIYKSLFEGVLMTVNRSLVDAGASVGLEQTSTSAFIGVLDIFGFECFEQNGFEQMLINFANESLQNTFNTHFVAAELRLFEAEHIECDLQLEALPNNQGCVDMICSRPDGVLSILDIVSHLPKPDDNKFCSRVHEKHDKSDFFPRTHPKDKRESFTVKHFAGSVKYRVGDWIDINNDNVPDAYKELAPTSAKLPKLCNFGGQDSASNGHKRRLTKATVASVFVQSMTALTETLNRTTCSFIRCIKPNGDMSPGVFDSSYITLQLRALGVLKTCEVLKVGLPTRLHYSELHSMIEKLPNASDAKAIFEGEPEEVLIASLLFAFEVDPEAYRLGRTRVFFRAGQITTVQSILNRDVSDAEESAKIVERLRQAFKARREAQEAERNARVAVDEAKAKFSELREELKAELSARDAERAEAKSVNDIDATTAQYVGEVRENVKAALGLDDLVREAREHVDRLKQEIAAAEDDDAKEVSHAVEEAEETLHNVEHMSKACAELRASVEWTRGEAQKVNTRAALLELWERFCKLQAEVTEMEMAASEATDGAARCQSQYALAKSTKATTISQHILAVFSHMSKEFSGVREGEERRVSLWVSCVAEAITLRDESAKAIQVARECRDASDAALKTLHEARMARLAEEERKLEEERRAEEVECRRRAEEERRMQEMLAKEEAEAKAIKAATAERKILLRHSSTLPEGNATDIEQIDVSAAPHLVPNSKYNGNEARKGSLGFLLGPVPSPPVENGDKLPPGWVYELQGNLPSPAYRNVLTKETTNKKPWLPASSRQDSGYIERMANAAGLSGVTRSPSTRHISDSVRLALNLRQHEGALLLAKRDQDAVKYHPCYVVLTESTLQIYQRKSDIGSSCFEKHVLELSSFVQLSHVAHGFAVITGRERMDFAAKDDAELTEWTTSVMNHIHAVRLELEKVEEDQMKRRSPDGRETYMELSPKYNAQAVLYEARDDGERTGKFVEPGEIVSVVERKTEADVVFLRLSDPTGWVRRNHRDSGVSMYRETRAAPLSDDEWCRVMTDALLKAQADAEHAIQMRQTEIAAVERLTIENQMLTEQLRMAGIVDDELGGSVRCCGVNPNCTIC